MFMNFRLFGIAVLYTFGLVSWPQPMLASDSHSVTTCEEFEQGAHFDPKEVVKSLWKIIYFWGNTTEINPIIFSLLAKKRFHEFQLIVNTIAPEMSADWHKAIFMMEPRPGVQVVFLYGGTPGAFRGVVKMEQRRKPRPYPEPLIKLADIRIKMVGKYLGMMCCEDLTAYVLARVDELPTTEEECETAAETVGLKGPGGRSYISLRNITRLEL